MTNRGAATSSGSTIKAFPTRLNVESSTAVSNGVIYVGSRDSNPYALNAAIGAKLWSHRTGNQVFASPSVVNGVVYVGSGDGNMYAFGL
jgi:eukaryotic-like serine/threonine-protein kinase